MLIRTTCDKCKEEADIAFYFYDARILPRDMTGTMDSVEYAALALGRSMCPYCGTEIRRQFTSALFRGEIIELATRKEIKRE